MPKSLFRTVEYFPSKEYKLRGIGYRNFFNFNRGKNNNQYFLITSQKKQLTECFGTKHFLYICTAERQTY